jgi:hypothetical protein
MLSKTPHDNFTMSAHYHSRPQETRIKKKSTLIRQLLQTDFLLIQIDYKNHVSVQMATETFGLFKKCLCEMPSKWRTANTLNWPTTSELAYN